MQKTITVKTLYGNLKITYSSSFEMFERYCKGCTSEEAHPIISCMVEDKSISSIYSQYTRNKNREKMMLILKNDIRIPSSSYNIDEKILFVTQPEKPKEKKMLLHTIFHEMGHYHLNHIIEKDAEKKIQNEKEAWGFAKSTTEEIFGKLNKKDKEMRDKYIAKRLEEYKDK